VSGREEPEPYVHTNVAVGEVLEPCVRGVVAVGGVFEPCRSTAVGAVGTLLTSPCFHKGLRATVVRPVWTEASRMNQEVAARCSGVPLPSRGRALGPSDRGILQEILEFSLDTPPLGGGWLRHRSE
jgi:hypothetical protein